MGAPKAVTAAAHKLARIFYLAMRHGMTHVRRSQEEYEAQLREKQIQSLKKRARHIGLGSQRARAPKPNG